MPAEKEDIPDTLERSPDRVQRTYEKTLGSAHDRYDSEERAHRAAWSSVKHIAEKKGDHWELKDGKGRSDPQRYWRAAALAAAVALAACGGDEQGTQTVSVTIGSGASADPAGERQGSGGSERASQAAQDLPGDCPDETLQPTGDNLPKIERATFCLLNAIRSERGLSELQRNRRLAEAATAHNQDMIERNYFAHVSPDGKGLTDWLRGTGYIPERGGWKGGENIGWAPQGAAQPARLVAGWMDSPSHRDNILDDDFVDIGIAVAPEVPSKGAAPGATYTTTFGAQSNRAVG